MLLYIHIPFCDSKCHYCAFNSYVDLFSFKSEYMEALKKQLQNELEKYNKKVETVFIGGGTPSTISPEMYEDIFKIIEPYKMEKNIEITIEANPNSATKEWQKGLLGLGVNRISFGVQSFDDTKLKFLGRNHNKKQAINAIETAGDIGFVNINSDIIYDTQIDTLKLLENDLQIIEKLPVNHISSYSLTIEKGTKFYTSPEVRKENIKIAKAFIKALEDKGFNQYEISNFTKTKTGKCKHNIGYWNYTEYLGIGSGVVGTIGNRRMYTKKDPLQYIQNPLEYESIEILSSDDVTTEKILLGLRSIVGIDYQLLSSSQKEKTEQLLEAGKLERKNNFIYANDYMIADELALYLCC